MFWQHRVDLRELVQSINKLSEKELTKRLPQITEALADKLEYSSIFRKTAFPKRLRSISAAPDLQSVLDEIFEFALEEKVWLGVEARAEVQSPQTN